MRRRGGWDGQGEPADERAAVAVAATAAEQAGDSATTLNGCPAAAGACWRRHTGLWVQRCPCSQWWPPAGHCNSAAFAGAAGGVATAHSGRYRENMAL